MNEKKFQVIFGKYLRANPPSDSEVYELKFARDGVIRFDALADHQLENLLKAKADGVYHKISDAPIHRGMRTRFTYKKPFDCLHINAVESYVVILFYYPREEKKAIFITAEAWQEEWNKSERKSLTIKRAREIASREVSLKGYSQ